MARTGIEPVTFHFSGERYYHLSYLAERSNSLPATPTGLEPATSAVTGRRANQLRYGALLRASLTISGQPGNYNVRSAGAKIGPPARAVAMTG